MSDRGPNWSAVARIWAQRSGFLIADILVISLALYLAYWLRFDGLIPGHHIPTMLVSIPLAIGLKVPVLALLRMYLRR